MSHTLHLQSDVSIRRGQVRRRDFLKAIPAAACAAGTLSWQDAMIASAADLRQAGHGLHPALDARRPEPVRDVLAPSRATPTAARPRRSRRRSPASRSPRTCRETAKAMNDLCLIRSMTSKEGSHPRATLPDAHRLPADGEREVSDARLDRRQRDRRPGERAAELRADRQRPASATARGSSASITTRSSCRPPAGRRRTLRSPPPSRATSAGSSLLTRLEAELRQPGRQAGSGRPSEALRPGGQDDPQPPDGGVRPRQGAAEDARRLRQRTIRPGLPAGPAAGRGGRDVRRSEPRQLGHAPRQLRPDARRCAASSTSRWRLCSPI